MQMCLNVENAGPYTRLCAPQYQTHHVFLDFPSGSRECAAGRCNVLGEEEELFFTFSYTPIPPKLPSLCFSKVWGLVAERAGSTFLRLTKPQMCCCQMTGSKDILPIILSVRMFGRRERGLCLTQTPNLRASLELHCCLTPPFLYLVKG